MDMKKILARHDIVFKSMPRTYREALPFGNGKFGGLCYRPAHWEWVVSKSDVDIDLWKDHATDPRVFDFFNRKVSEQETKGT